MLTETLRLSSADWETLPESLFLLPKTGFDINLEGRRICREFNEDIHKKSYQEVADYLSSSTIESMIKFWEEYLRRKSVMGISVDRSILNGEARMVLRRNGKPWISIFADEDLDIKQAAEKLEPKVNQSGPGSIVLLISPKRDALPESQIYVYHIDSANKLDASVIRIDRTTAQIEDFLELLDSKYKRLNPEKFTEAERTRQLTTSSPHLEGRPDLGQYYDTPYVIKKLQEAHPDLPFLFEQKTFEQVSLDFELKNHHGLDEECKLCLVKFQRFFESFFEQNKELFQAGIVDQEALRPLKIAMGKTILDMSAIMRQKRQASSSTTVYLGNLNYHEELSYLQELQGCVPIFGQEGKAWTGKCPHCGAYNIGTRKGDKCVGCGRTYEGC